MTRWYFTFASILGRTCRVNINDDTYTGEAVELSISNASAPGYPTEAPVMIEEDDPMSLLEFIRPKTGYLSLIEREPGSLRALFPSSNRQFRVEVYYNSTLYFRGYVQAQNFDGLLYSYREKVKLPIMSTLSTLLEQELPAAWPGMGEVSVETIFHSILSGEYTKVIAPGNFINIALMRTIVNPVNDEYNFGLGTEDSVPPIRTYIKRTYRDFLENLMALTGCMVHEVADTLAVTQFDYNGTYYRYDVSSLDTSGYTPEQIQQPAVTPAIADGFIIASDKLRDKMRNALRRITIETEPLRDEIKLEWKLSTYVGATTIGGEPAAVLRNEDESLTSDYFTTSVGTLGFNELRIVGDGRAERMEVNFVREDVPMFKWSYEDNMNDGNIYDIVIKMTETIVAGKLAIAIRCGDEYLHFDDGQSYWDTTFGTFEVTANDKEYRFRMETNGRRQVYEMSVYKKAATTATEVFRYDIESIGIEPSDEYSLAAYTATPSRKAIIVTGDSRSMDEASLSSAFSRYSPTSGISQPTFSYMTTSQRVLEIPMRMQTAITDFALMYLHRTKVWQESGEFKITAVEFSPADDEMTFQLQHC